MSGFIKELYEKIDIGAALYLSILSIGMLFGAGFMYGETYYRLRLLTSGKIERYTLESIEYVPSISTREGIIPAKNILVLKEIDMEIESSTESTKKLKPQQIIYCAVNKKINLGVYLPEKKLTFKSVLEPDFKGILSVMIFSVLLAISTLIACWVVCFKSFLVHWKRLRGKISDSESIIKWLNITKSFLSYAPLMGIVLALVIILVVGVFKVESIGMFTTGCVINGSVLLASWSPYLILNAKELITENKTAKTITLMIKIVLSVYTFSSTVFFLFTSDFSAYKNISDLLKALFKFITGG